MLRITLWRLSHASVSDRVEAHPRFVVRQLVQSLSPRSGPGSPSLSVSPAHASGLGCMCCVALVFCMLGLYACLRYVRCACMKGCCLLAYTRMLSALKLLCSALFGTWVVFVYTRWRLACCICCVLYYWGCAGFVCTHWRFACFATCLLRICCTEAPLVSCARAGVLHLGIPNRPCCARLLCFSVQLAYL